MIKWITKELATARRRDVKEGVYKIVDARDMVDGMGNSKDAIMDKINSAIRLIKKGHKIIICCDYGLSRSNAVAIGVLVKYYGYDFEDAVSYLMKKTRKKAIQLGVLNSVRDVLKLNNPASKNKKTILIIKDNNFIAKNIVSLLKDKYDLIIPLKSDVDLIKSPIGLDFIVKKFRVGLIVYFTGPNSCAISQIMGDMVVMLRNILDVCKENKTPILYLSSGAVFSGYRKKTKVSEDLFPFPRDTYGEVMMLCEYLLNHYKQNYGLDICLLRLARVYGLDGDKVKFIQNFFEKAKNNLPVYTHKYKNGFPVLDLVHIRDVANAVSIAIDKKFYGTLNIGSGSGISTFDIAKKIKKICNSSSAIHFQKIDGYDSNAIMDINKAQKYLGWFPKVDINDGLAELSKNLKIYGLKTRKKQTRKI